MKISDEMGGLLWRHVYEARINMDSHVPPMLYTTLEALLTAAGIPEPDDKVVLWRTADGLVAYDFGAQSWVPRAENSRPNPASRATEREDA